MGHYVKWTRLLFSRQLPHDGLKRKKNYHHVSLASLVSHSFKSSVSTILHKIIKHKKGLDYDIVGDGEEEGEKVRREMNRGDKKNYRLPIEII